MILLLSAGTQNFSEAQSFQSIEVSSYRSLSEGNGSIRNAIIELLKKYESQTTFSVWDYEKNHIATIDLHDTNVHLPKNEKWFLNLPVNNSNQFVTKVAHIQLAMFNQNTDTLLD